MKRMKRSFHVAAGAAGGFLPASHGGSHRLVAPMSGVALQGDGEREPVVQPQVFGLAQGRLDGVRRIGSEVEDRPGRGRHGNPVLDSCFVGQEGGVMGPDHAPRTGSAG